VAQCVARPIVKAPPQKQNIKKISGVGWFLERKKKEDSLNLMELRAGGVDSKKKKDSLDR
jgi:hypothetical protein